VSCNIKQYGAENRPVWVSFCTCGQACFLKTFS